MKNDPNKLKLKTCKTCASSDFEHIPNGLKCSYCGNEYYFDKFDEFEYEPFFAMPLVTCITSRSYELASGVVKFKKPT